MYPYIKGKVYHCKDDNSSSLTEQMTKVNLIRPVMLFTLQINLKQFSIYFMEKIA